MSVFQRPFDFLLPCFLALLGLASPANAVLTLSLDDGGGPTVVTDDDGDGVLRFAGVLTNFTVNGSTGISKPTLIGTPSLFDLNSVNVSNGAGTLVLELSDSGFTNPGMILTSSIGGTTDGSIAYEAFVNPTNGDPFLGTLIGSEAFTETPFAGLDMFAANLQPGLPYSLGLRVTITHDSNLPTISSFDANIRIPEPGVLGLLGMGLLLTAFVVRRGREVRFAKILGSYLGYRLALTRDRSRL